MTSPFSQLLGRGAPDRDTARRDVAKFLLAHRAHPLIGSDVHEVARIISPLLADDVNQAPTSAFSDIPRRLFTLVPTMAETRPEAAFDRDLARMLDNLFGLVAWALTPRYRDRWNERVGAAVFDLRLHAHPPGRLAEELLGVVSSTMFASEWTYDAAAVAIAANEQTHAWNKALERHDQLVAADQRRPPADRRAPRYQPLRPSYLCELCSVGYRGLYFELLRQLLTSADAGEVLVLMARRAGADDLRRVHVLGAEYDLDELAQAIDHLVLWDWWTTYGTATRTVPAGTGQVPAFRMLLDALERKVNG
jgi:hypothetical protein